MPQPSPGSKLRSRLLMHLLHRRNCSLPRFASRIRQTPRRPEESNNHLRTRSVDENSRQSSRYVQVKRSCFVLNHGLLAQRHHTHVFIACFVRRTCRFRYLCTYPHNLKRALVPKTQIVHLKQRFTQHYFHLKTKNVQRVDMFSVRKH